MLTFLVRYPVPGALGEALGAAQAALDPNFLGYCTRCRTLRTVGWLVQMTFSYSVETKEKLESSIPPQEDPATEHAQISVAKALLCPDVLLMPRFAYPSRGGGGNQRFGVGFGGSGGSASAAAKTSGLGRYVKKTTAKLETQSLKTPMKFM